MECGEVLRFMLSRSGKSQRDISKACGKSPTWASALLAKQVPQLDTVARIADATGLDVVLVDRATGERVAVVDVPSD